MPLLVDELNKKIKIAVAITMFMVLSSWHSHCDSAPGLSEQRQPVRYATNKSYVKQQTRLTYQN